MKLPKSYIVFDVETANTNRDSICQIGITYIANEIVRSIKTVNVNPECSFNPHNTNIHGITEAAVKDAKSYPDMYPVLRKILEKYVVFHHSQFDYHAIQATCTRYRLPNIETQWTDSIEFFKYHWPQTKNNSYKLSELCKTHKIQFQHHDAGQDTFATAQLLNLAANKRPLHIPKQFLPKKIDGKFTGKSIIFSGNMNKLKLEQQAKNVGFEIVANVTQKTDYLCIGKTDQRTIDSGNTKSGKQKKAEQQQAKGHHIKVINEAQFLNLISE